MQTREFERKPKVFVYSRVTDAPMGRGAQAPSANQQRGSTLPAPQRRDLRAQQPITARVPDGCSKLSASSQSGPEPRWMRSRSPCSSCWAARPSQKAPVSSPAGPARLLSRFLGRCQNLRHRQRPLCVKKLFVEEARRSVTN